MPMAHAPSSPADADPSKSFRPYVPADQEPAELTFRAVALGSLLGVVFGASSLYLFLKVGMTVSASIPVAVLAITIFRGLSYAFGLRRATILENNVVQTAGSAGESIAFGVGATMPALMLLGYDLEWSRVMLVSVLGGLLGILMMIPLRKAFIVKQHGTLPYPEGTACAKVLIVGEHGGSNARTVFLGFGLGAIYKVLMQGLKLWPEGWDRAITGIKGYNKAVVAIEPDPTLLGVGYIIGPRIAAVMVGGGLLTSLMLVPMIAYFGEELPGVLPPGQARIAEMGPGAIAGQYVRYIGAGAVATGGILSMLNALPLIFSSIAGSLRALKSAERSTENGVQGTPRTDRDIPMPLVLLGTLGLVALIASSNLIPADASGRIAGAFLIVLFGFLFVTVSSRITGVIGSSSNPISGMTIATLLLTCLIFVMLGWVGGEYRLIALSIAAIVCIASSNGGTISQDLKTGYLVGATPWRQQVAILIGALLSAVVMGGTLLWLNDAYTTVSNRPEDLPTAVFDVSKLTETDTHEGREFKVLRLTAPIEGALPGTYLVDEAGKAQWIRDAGIGGRLDHSTSGEPVKKFNPPQPRLFATIIDGIMSGDLPWGLVILGAVLAIVVQLAGVSSLAFAVGVYLPLSTTLPIFVGGLVRLLVDRARNFSAADSETSPGTMMATGLIAGGSLAGILIAVLKVYEDLGKAVDFSTTLPGGEVQYLLPALGAFSVLTIALVLVAMTSKRQAMIEVSEDHSAPVEGPDA
ncbi:OPT family oligopeptide transporter [Planctomyces sp. SH-PL62]|uniref:OPT family oligopeptide transporter n=1 Tax=Planctomyces sp. SH-PL62 TaxID=1636152 RepID=UPI00078BDD77|nr:oligopeptide transporter, OPT family [Planctomyces sp. SH-PL62]AMV38775.1 OPT oligopeptide transporter protein [Planctomyces sp. SH-PL62]